MDGEVKPALWFATRFYGLNMFNPLVTIYDALDTIWIMDLEDIWDDAMIVVANATFAQTEAGCVLHYLISTC